MDGYVNIISIPFDAQTIRLTTLLMSVHCTNSISWNYSQKYFAHSLQLSNRNVFNFQMLGMCIVQQLHCTPTRSHYNALDWDEVDKTHFHVFKLAVLIKGSRVWGPFRAFENQCERYGCLMCRSRIDRVLRIGSLCVL